MFISAFLSPYDELFNIKQNFKMKKYMPLEGLRWSRDSGSTLCDTPQNGRSRTGWGGWKYEMTKRLPDITHQVSVLKILSFPELPFLKVATHFL